MIRRWQGDDQSPFKFGRPNFFPVVMVHYQDGARKGEFTGPVHSKSIVSFMRRHAVPAGVRLLKDFPTAD